MCMEIFPLCKIYNETKHVIATEIVYVKFNENEPTLVHDQSINVK